MSRAVELAKECGAAVDMYADGVYHVTAEDLEAFYFAVQRQALMDAADYFTDKNRTTEVFYADDLRTLADELTSPESQSR